MTQLQIRQKDVARTVRTLNKEVSPTDDLRCLAILRDEIASGTLPDFEYVIRAWHPTRGWIEHRPA